MKKAIGMAKRMMIQIMVEDENIDVKVDGNTCGEILKKTLCAISTITEETEIDGKWFAIV